MTLYFQVQFLIVKDNVKGPIRKRWKVRERYPHWKKGITKDQKKMQRAKERYYRDSQSRTQDQKRKYQKNPEQKKEYEKKNYQENPKPKKKKWKKNKYSENPEQKRAYKKTPNIWREKKYEEKNVWEKKNVTKILN